jgi:hypothetical protein
MKYSAVPTSSCSNKGFDDDCWEMNSAYSFIGRYTCRDARPCSDPRVLVVVVLLLCSLFSPLTAQTLNLPPRPSGAMGGDAFAASVAALTRDQREEQIFQAVMSGNIPDFLRQLIPMTSTATLGGVPRVARWYVAPEYVAIGSNDDYFLMPMTPLLAQRIADATGCTLPTRKMVDAIYAAASVKVAPIPIPPSGAMITVPVFKQHNDTLRVQRAPLLAAHPLGELVGGHKKDVIISNAITTNLKPTVPKPVVIYGWHQLNGVPIQPLYNGHEQTYADYSHGIRLVQRAAMLDSAAVMIDDILRDPVLWALFSDEGLLANPRYGALPNSVPRDGAAPTRPDGLELLQNYPNPFNPSTKIGYAIAGTGHEAPGNRWIRLAVYDLVGREVAVLVDGSRASGFYDVLFDARNLAGGTYLYRLQDGVSTLTRPCLLLR